MKVFYCDSPNNPRFSENNLIIPKMSAASEKKEGITVRDDFPHDLLPAEGSG